MNEDQRDERREEELVPIEALFEFAPRQAECRSWWPYLHRPAGRPNEDADTDTRSSR